MCEYMQKFFLVLCITILSVFPGCAPADSNLSDSSADITVFFDGLEANSAPGETTTALILTFDRAVSGFTAADITVTGEGALAGVGKGSLSRTRFVYTLAVTGIVADGFLTVSVNKSGYTFIEDSKTVAVYYASSIPSDTVNFIALSANGGVAANTTELTLTFSTVIPGLSADDITLTPNTVTAGGPVAGPKAIVEKGALSGAGPVYTLTVAVTGGGALTVSAAKDGITFDRNRDVFVNGDFLAFTPLDITPYWWGGSWINSADLRFSSSGPEADGSWWAEGAKSQGYFGFASNREYAINGNIPHNWALVDPNNPSVKYKHSVSYELKISSPALTEEFLDFRLDLNWERTSPVQRQIRANLIENFSAVKAFLKANPTEYYRLTYNNIGGLPDFFPGGLYFLFELIRTPAAQVNIPGARVSIRDIRFHRNVN